MDRPGFTLPEILVAMLLTALLLAATHHLTATVSDATASMSRAATAADRTVNSERLLRKIAASYEADVSAQEPFVGSSRTMHFRSWCDTPGGWQERCEVTLRLVAVDTGLVLRGELDVGGQKRIEVFGPVGHDAAFRYLEDAAHGGILSDSWAARSVAPSAISVPFGNGSLLMRFGGKD